MTMQDARTNLVVGNELRCFDDGFTDSDGGVITSVTADTVAWITFNGDDREDTIAAIFQGVEQKLCEIVARPICGCPEHVGIDTGECDCTPECIRGEARHLDFTSREALIEYLSWADQNGCYTDEDATLEFGKPHTLEILQGAYRGVWDLE